MYDPIAGRVLLAGGSTPTNGGRSFQFFNDLWAFDGAAWAALSRSGTERSGIALVFDSRRQRVLSFGGYSGSASLGDLRLLEGTSWRTIGQHPELVAAEAGFVYDSHRDRFVEFGGSAGQRQSHGDTWELDGDRWTKLPITGPAARQAQVMIYDPRRQRTVLFGGMGVLPPGTRQPPVLGDLWEFDGTTWVERTAAGPSPRMGAGGTYDSKRGLLIVFGGSDSAGELGDTWSWDGTTWRKLSDTGPEARAMGYLAYDAKRDRVVLFGGRKGYPDGDRNDTWEWDGAAWHRVP